MKSIEEKLADTSARLSLRTEQVPRHIAIIMDGNGRWARQRNLPRVRGHHEGAKTAEKIAQYCSDIGVRALTLYSFSVENWKRPKAEVSALMHLNTEYLIRIRPSLMKNNVKLIHLGRVRGLPITLCRELKKTMEITRRNTGMVLALALNYGGRAEIVDATRRIAREYNKGLLRLKDINEQCISRHLYTANLPEPDLLIRTANELRVSNFLLWQISYSEFHVTKTLWPDFDNAELDKAILVYAQRDRRFGALDAASKPSICHRA